MMKKVISVVLVIVMAALAVTAVSAEQKTAAADNIPVILTFLNRGARVETAGKYDDTYTIVRTDSGFGLIRTEFLTMSEEQPYSAWDGFAMWDCWLYRSYNMTGEALTQIKTNDRVKVLEELSGCYCVMFEDGIGYVAKNQVSQWTYTAPDYSGNGSGSDGGDIYMRGSGYSLNLLSAITQSAPVSGSGVVKIDAAPVYLGFYKSGDHIEVLDHSDEDSYVTVKMDGMTGHLRTDYLSASNVSKTAYAAGSASVFSAADLYGRVVKQVWTNNELTILCEFDDSYYVSVGGQTGYLAKDMVRDSIVYYGSGSTDGGNQWSDPVL